MAYLRAIHSWRVSSMAVTFSTGREMLMSSRLYSRSNAVQRVEGGTKWPGVSDKVIPKLLHILMNMLYW